MVTKQRKTKEIRMVQPVRLTGSFTPISFCPWMYHIDLYKKVFGINQPLLKVAGYDLS